MRRVETTIKGGKHQRVNSDHNARVHTWKPKRRSQSTKGVSDKPLRASITRFLPAGLHWSNHFDMGFFVVHPRTSALCRRARWWTVVIFAIFTSALAAKSLAGWPPVVEHAGRRDVGPVSECQTRRGRVDGVAVHRKEFAR